MLDDFLKEDETSSFLDEIEATSKLELTAEPETGFMGMTAVQRFIISLMVFFMVLILGTFFLLITGIIAIPVS
jgi:hypothetical protein